MLQPNKPNPAQKTKRLTTKTVSKTSTQKKTKKYALGTGEKGVDPSKRKLFDESSISSNGLADVGFNTSGKNFGLNAGVGFNPEDLYGRIGGSFNKKGLNTSANFTQRPEGKYSLDTDLGYGNENINTSLGYSRTDTGEQFTGNISAGSDKLKLVMDYLKNAEGDNLNTGLSFNNQINNASGESLGTLDTRLGAGINSEEASLSGNLNFNTKAFQEGQGFNYNAGFNYSDTSGPNINAGVKYRFGNGTNQEGIMKKSMNPRKKYGNGTPGGGIGASNYIETPAETMNNYDIMLAKAGSEAMSNPWLPVVSIIGGLAQQAAGSLAGKLGKKPGTGDTGDINTSTIGDNNSRMAAMGMNNVQQDVEVEDGERYKTPAGQTGEFEGATHEENGIPLEVTQDPNANPEEGQVPKGTQIFSDRIKVGNKTIAERQATREKQKANLEKQAVTPNIDQALKNAVKRKMASIQKEEQMDLAFQGQVDNMQQMADMAVQAFAYGTSMAGIQDNPIGDSMRYGYGTGTEGIKEYALGTDDFGLLGDPPYGKTNPMYGEEDNPIKAFQIAMGVTPTGKALKKTQAAWDKYLLNSDKKLNEGNYGFPWESRTLFNKPKQEQEYYTKLGLTPSGRQFKQTASALGNPFNGTLPPVVSTIPMNAAGKVDLSKMITPPPIAGINKRLQAELNAQAKPTEDQGPSKLRTIFEQMGENAPGIGDVVKLAGNYMGMTAGTKNAFEQRASDVTHTNPFAKAGEEALKSLERMQASIEGQKAQALINNTTQQRTANKSVNNSSRSINTKRSMNWLYDTAATSASNEIVKNTQGQLAQLEKDRTTLITNIDQMKGQGQYQAEMANEAAKDAFYTALGQGKKDFATGLQQTGADLNDMKQNKIINNLMKNYGTYVQADENGNLSNKLPLESKKSVLKKDTKVKKDSALEKKIKDLNLTSKNLTPDSKGMFTLPNGNKVSKDQFYKLLSTK